MKRVARQLGFKRTGENIRARIAAALNGLLADGSVRLSDADGRVWLAPPNESHPVP